MNKCKLFFLLVFSSGLSVLSAQSIVFNFPDTIVGPNQAIELPLTTRDFIDIGSVQFSLQWDVAVMSYQGFEEVAIENVGVGDTDAANGRLRFSWFPNSAEPVSFDDGTTLVRFQFETTNAVGSTTDMSITDMPLQVQVSQQQGAAGNYVLIDVVQETGSVTISSLGSVSLQSQDISCFGFADGQIELDVPGLPDMASYNWTGPNMFTSTEEDLDALESGSYNLEIQDVDGNVLYDTTIVITEPEELMVSEISTEVIDCEEGIGSASITAMGGVPPYSFTLNGMTNTDGQFDGLGPEFYTAMVTDANGCMASDTFSLVGGAAPQLIVQGDFDICPGEIAVLDAGIHQSYEWSTGEDTPSIIVFEPGFYSVTVDDGLPCTASAEIEVTPGGELQIEVNPDFVEICRGESVELMATGGDVFEWIDTTGSLSATNIANPVATPQFETTYTIISSNNCASDTLDYTVFVLQTPADGGPDTCILQGKELQLEASGGISYQWQGDQFPVSDPIAADPITTPLDSTFYIVDILDENNCLIRDTVFVAVVSEPTQIRTYNLLTPNGDGKNDILVFDGLGKFTENSLRIFNRWGNLVYDKVNYQDDDERFDGTYNGKPLPAGTYFYILKLRSGEIKEAFTIVRE